jgi:hypothetical protein
MLTVHVSSVQRPSLGNRLEVRRIEMTPATV